MAEKASGKVTPDPYEVTPELVRHVAKLAALDLDADDEAHFRAEMNRILNHMKQLKTVDTEGIEAAFQSFPSVNVMREDRVDPGLSAAEVLQNAPEKEEPFFKMPPILGSEKP